MDVLLLGSENNKRSGAPPTIVPELDLLSGAVSGLEH